jgi:ribosomal-protein-alanine N-acetyltransferase
VIPLAHRLLEKVFGPPALHLAPLAPIHAGAAAALHGASFAHGWDAAGIARMIADPAILSDAVLIGGGRSIARASLGGFVMSRIAADEAEILTICVDESRRGAGIGRRLLDTHIDALSRHGVTRLFLEVDEGNAPARALYRRLGFAQVGAREGYYRKPDGGTARALILRRDMP